MKCVVELSSGGVLFIPSFMKTGAVVEGILRFCLSNLKGCNVGITVLLIEGIYGVFR
jgi:hypothetical protein